MAKNELRQISRELIIYPGQRPHHGPDTPRNILYVAPNPQFSNPLMKITAFLPRSLSPCEAKGKSEFRHTPARPGKLLTVHYSPLPPHHPLLVTTALHCKVSDKLIRLTYFDVGRRNIRGIVRTHLQ